MFLDFIATAAAAFAAAGVVLIVMRVLRLRLPKWIIPVTAGAAMLGYAIWSEYSWFPRVAGALPPTVEVVANNGRSDWWRPWTYARPLVSSFLALDRGSMMTNDNAPGQRILNVLVVTRWQGSVTVPVLFDCPGGRRADLIDGAEFAPDGTLADVDWRPMPAEDPVFVAACAGA